MTFLAWSCVAILAGAIVTGILGAWIAEDDPAAHAERDAKEDP